MTGFGEASAENESYRVTATLRSVNHRFLDVSVRLADGHRRLESSLMQQVRARLGRGRVELRLEIKPRDGGNLGVTIDESAASSYLEAARRLAEQESVDGGLAAAELLRLPGVASVESGDEEFSGEDREIVVVAVEAAIEALIEARQAEGTALAAVLQRVLGELTECVARLAEMSGSLQSDVRSRLEARLAELAGETPVEPQRLAQEVTLLVDRADVQEEIDRLRLHVEQFGAHLDDDEPVGKRLDFLSQEILRELNTIGSKCRDSQATQWVIDGKVLCEQLREQVQNLE